MLKAFCSLFLCFVALSFPVPTVAAYVLPYPSLMPGHKLYRVMRFVDEMKRYWYWGSLSSYRYYLGQSDKALVEAKTLFEYQQFLLATRALKRSNDALIGALDPLRRAKGEGKDIEKYTRELVDAMDVHKRLIVKLKAETPEEFYWIPEKSDPQILPIHQALFEAERIRSDALSKLP